MDGSSQPLEFPPLREHDFHSNLPVLGPVVSWLRRGLYALTTKWPLRVMMAQQDRINQTMAAQLTSQRADLDGREAALRQTDAELRQTDAELRQADAELRQIIADLEQRQEAAAARLRALEVQLREFEDRLIDQDRDWAYVTRTVAELDLKVKYRLESDAERAGDRA